MTYATAIKFYKTQPAIARVLGISKQAVGQWQKSGVVPVGSALLLQIHSKRKVKVDPKVYVRSAIPTPRAAGTHAAD